MGNSKTTCFPDQSHIDRVRDALWQRSGGGASVMVGSGFSRNALKTRPDAGDIPMWPELAKAISDRLYTLGCEGDRYSEILETPTTDGLLKIAQEYEAAFGPSDLRLLLKQLVRDDDYNPGEAHKRLLRLPWRDIFTTNWDTLLEKTRISVPSRAYSVVRSMDSIPLSGRPRIVKLHGSFPDYFPLIFTEEDYRTYPTNFAPFVNTVQQAMMETVFLLVGFSGNDPNFLNWSGWVRDNLGDASPKIYLAGWLNLSPHKRRMLENRNVVPIDLVHHPKAGEWPEHLRYKYAIEWILHTLERGRPYDIIDWPSQRDWKYPDIPKYIQPVQESSRTEPEKEQDSQEIKTEELHKHVKLTLDIWMHNRKIYPGWLIIPASAQYSLSLNTNKWEPHILKILPDFTPRERLNAIYELIWRRKTLLDPILPELESVAEETLELVNCQDRTIEGMDNIEIDWIVIREEWRTIALALVTAARYRFDYESFNRRIENLLPFLHDDPNIDHRLRHERCLWASYSMDFEALENLIEDWKTEDCDPAWMMRKASMFFEIGRDDEAKEFIKIALKTIREMPIEDHSVARSSREAWALWSADSLANRKDIVKRWRELAPLKCNALSERRAYIDAVEEKNTKEEPYPFDLGMRPPRMFSFSHGDYNYNKYITIYRMIRLSEIAGMPPAVDHMDIASDILKLAADKLSVLDIEDEDIAMAARLILRAVTYDKDKILMRVLSRTRIAVLPTKYAKILSEICNSGIDYALPRMAGADGRKRNLFWILRMRVFIEVNSRLVLRLDSDTAEVILDKALGYYRTDGFIQNRELAWALENMLKRSWEALPENRRTKRFFDLLGAPIAGVDNFALIRSDKYDQYPDPGFLLRDDFPPPIRTDDNSGKWQAIVDLLVRGLQCGGEARRRATIRVRYLAFLNQLTETESSHIAQALWSEEYTNPNDLPRGTGFHDWALLLLPEPEPGLAERCFRFKWLSSKDASEENVQSPDDILWQVGCAIYDLKKNKISFALSDNERTFVQEMLERWSDTSVPHDDFSLKENQLRQPVYRALRGLPDLILEVKVSEDIGEKLYAKMERLNKSGIPAFLLTPGLVKALPKKFYEIVSLMKMGLVSEHENLSANALQALHFWLETTTDPTSKLRKPPKDLIREIGFIIAARRRGALVQALQAAKWIFDAGRDIDKKIIKNLLLEGLDYLAKELRYDREYYQDDKEKNQSDQNDIPLQRWCCARLALSMANQGLKNDPIISRWLEIAAQDPLPEVRYVDKTAFAHHYEKK